MTITAKHKGPRGNNITFRASWVNGTKRDRDRDVDRAVRHRGTISGSKLTGGTTADSLANAILPRPRRSPFDMFAMAHDDTTNINRVRDDLETKNGPLVMLWAQAVAGITTSPSVTATQAAAINSTRDSAVAGRELRLALRRDLGPDDRRAPER
jgi:phage tail sheath gpL-like